MTLWLGVENFGKIKEARICINKFTVLVGPNNCGKSFLMQLADGINDYLMTLDEVVDITPFLVEEKEGIQEYSISHANCVELVTAINETLVLQKENAIKSILGKEVAIGKLYIDLEMDESEEYQVLAIDLKKAPLTQIEKRMPYRDKFIDNILKSAQASGDGGLGGSLVLLSECNPENNTKRLRYASNSSVPLNKNMVQRVITKGVFSTNSLYMPSSRNGLLLLYRDFFANRADHTFEFNLNYHDEVVETIKADSGLTKPIYKFLRFLQTYSYVENEREKKDLEFFNQQIIEGNIAVNEQGVFSYQSEQDKLSVPMYLASSMINELVPLHLALTTRLRYRRLVIDEIESSLHPQKQVEVVRLLNRLNNSGYQFIISTHSDTIASEISNLSRLSVAKIGREQLECIGLEEKDIIKPENLYVYEFHVGEDGRSVVQEVRNSQSGYQFELFTNSALQLYMESKKIGEILSKDDNKPETI